MNKSMVEMLMIIGWVLAIGCSLYVVPSIYSFGLTCGSYIFGGSMYAWIYKTYDKET